MVVAQMSVGIMFLPHRQAGQPALRLPGVAWRAVRHLPAYAAKTPRSTFSWLIAASMRSREFIIHSTFLT